MKGVYMELSKEELKVLQDILSELNVFDMIGQWDDVKTDKVLLKI